MSRFFRSLFAARALRWLSTGTTEGEDRLSVLLKQKFPRATTVGVTDVSGGCGAMYEITVESPDFEGKSRVQQHKMVNEALKEEIKSMHGLRIFTAVPKKPQEK